PGEVTLNGSLSLSNFKPQGFHLAAAASGISLSQLAVLLHRPIDVSGSANAGVLITGAFAHPVITGGITLHDATVQQYALTTATTTFSYAPDLAALRLSGAGARSSSGAMSQRLSRRTAQSTSEQASRQVADLLRGLDLRTLDVRSPMANLHAVGTPIGPDGGIHIDATVSNISLGTLRLPPQVMLQEAMGARIAVRGNVRQPEIIVSLGRGDSTVPLTGSIQPVQLQIDGQPFDLSAENVTLEPDLAALTSHTPGLSMIRRLAVGSLSLLGQGQAITLTGEVMPRLSATAAASGFRLSTLAGMLQQPLPDGLSGTLRSARLSVQGVLPPVTSALSAEMARPGFASRTMRSLSGSLAVTLADIQMVPPVARTVRTGPTAPGTGIPPRRPPGAIRVETETPATVSAAT
ncbi:MAG: translocation/assembly module TamB, partial [Chloroflexi bacterium]|nr:translocation/assembly module TamB [Chloroflexota bacterium]